MRAFSIFFFIFTSFNFCSMAQELTESERSAIQSFKLSPSFFIPNTVSQNTGKRLVDDDQVLAFMQTQKGRVMFTPNGAYIGMAVPIDEFEKPKTEAFDLHKRMDKDIPDTRTRTVVLKAGFSITQAKKRGIVPRLEEKTSGTVNFMVGPKENWRTKVPTYQKLIYDQVWDGIDLEYLGFMDHLEFRLYLEPGTDPEQIVMETGGDELKILEDGKLAISLAGAELILSAPFAFQDIQGETIEVPVHYQIVQKNKLGFQLGPYSTDFPLVIHPTLDWSTYLGGAGGDGTESGQAITVDDAGSAYVTGSTPSADYPATTGVFDESWNSGQYDVFVSKLSSDGSALSYSTFLGGSDYDRGFGIAVDSNGNAYVTGYTWSSDYPTTSGAYDETHNGVSDVFTSKLSSDGRILVFSSFLGGGSYDRGTSIAVDSSGNAYVTGYTWSGDYPTTNGAYDQSHHNFWDGFVSKLNSVGSDLVYSTFLGGYSYDYSFGVTLDSSGNAYLTGYTWSRDFPTTSGAYDQSYNGGNSDVFVSRLSSDGSELVYSTYLGGVSDDESKAIALDSSGNVYVIGTSNSYDYPATSGAYDESHNGGPYDVFVSKLSSDGGVLIYSTFLGGGDSDYGNGIAVDASGNAYVTGYTRSVYFPTTNGAYDETANGDSDVFVSKLSSDGSSLIYSTFLSGSSSDIANGIAVDTSENAYVTGYTWSSDYPTTNGAFDVTHNCDSDVFVGKLNSDGSGLSYSTFLGGSGSDFGYGISVDMCGNSFVTGTTWSSDYPTTSGAYDESQNGFNDVFVSKLSSDGRNLVYSTFLGGISYDYSYGVALDTGGNAYMTGYTWSSDFPTTNGAYGESHNGGNSDVFVSKLSSDGSELVYSTYLGGASDEESIAIALDLSGNAYITGNTNSLNFPTTSGVVDRDYNGNSDVFVSKLSSDGSALSYSTFLGGGSGYETGTGIAVNSGGNAYVTGWTNSYNFPTTTGAFNEFYNGGSSDVFMSRLSSDGSFLVYSSFLGGFSNDKATAIAVDSSGNAYVTGYTSSDYFPTTNGAYDETLNGDSDVFVSKLSSEGNGLIYSTYLGGSSNDEGFGIVLDIWGNVYVTGYTMSSDYPTTNGAYDETPNGGFDVFVGKLSSEGNELIYSTYIGGSNNDYGYGLGLNNIGNVYVTGFTNSLEFPTTSGVYDDTQNGSGDAFITKLIFNLDFSELLPYWNHYLEQTHFVTILDLLHANLYGQLTCP